MFIAYSCLLSKCQSYVSIKNTVENSLVQDSHFWHLCSSLLFSKTKRTLYINLSKDYIFIKKTRI